jgi:Big-like domain-containing protein
MGPQPRAPSGAIVFGTGTVFLSFGLDTTHDYANDDPNGLVVPVDPNVQQAMVNLFADMSVQPQTLQSDLIAATASTDHTPPVSTISAPVAGASFVQQQPVTISGSASDTGGLVAVVEVSTDGGTTWNPATGTTSWIFVWWPRLPKSFTIKSRGVDDSLNMETPSAGVSVTVTPAATVSLFTPTDTPFAVLANDSSAVEIGVKIQVNIADSASGIRF